MIPPKYIETVILFNVTRTVSKTIDKGLDICGICFRFFLFLSACMVLQIEMFDQAKIAKSFEGTWSGVNESIHFDFEFSIKKILQMDFFYFYTCKNKINFFKNVTKFYYKIISVMKPNLSCVNFFYIIPTLIKGNCLSIEGRQ